MPVDRHKPESISAGSSSPPPLSVQMSVSNIPLQKPVQCSRGVIKQQAQVEDVGMCGISSLPGHQGRAEKMTCAARATSSWWQSTDAIPANPHPCRLVALQPSPYLLTSPGPAAISEVLCDGEAAPASLDSYLHCCVEVTCLQ